MAELNRIRAKRVQLDQDYVLTSVIDTMERCKQAQAVLDAQGNHIKHENADGEMVPAYKFDPAAVLKGSELLAKHLKMFESEEKQTVVNLHFHEGSKDI